MADDSGAALYEFFAGGGFARLGLEPLFACTFANDFDAGKAAAYRAAFGPDHLVERDVWAIKPADLPGRAALAWASSPCQDVSLAGARQGLSAARSGAFWGFWRLIEALDAEGRGPAVVALENVSGLLTSHGGADFAALCGAMAASGRTVGALEIDASLFTPQSRPRVFVIAARAAPAGLLAPAPTGAFHTKAVCAAHARLPEAAQAAWAWWRLPAPPLRNHALADILEPEDRVRWRADAATQRLLEQMSPRQSAQIDALLKRGEARVGAAFRRVRVEDGVKVQRVEARFDGLAGCLRTPAGGSSKQILLAVGAGRVRSRLMTAREAARLMGAPDSYPLPAGETAGLHLVGDAVAPPVVRWLAERLLKPMAEAARTQRAAPSRAATKKNPGAGAPG